MVGGDRKAVRGAVGGRAVLDRGHPCESNGGLDRVAATRLSFFLSIPALLAAGIFELKDALGGDIGVGETAVGTLVSFVVAYASIAWLLRFVAGHSIAAFVPYRVALGVILLALLATGTMSAT